MMIYMLLYTIKLKTTYLTLLAYLRGSDRVRVIDRKVAYMGETGVKNVPFLFHPVTPATTLICKTNQK